MEFLAIIPARYGSTRFPGKPLIDLSGKSMIERVYKQAAQVFDNLYVATDHPKIYDEVLSFGGRALMTATSHTNGTSRVAEAMVKIEKLRGRACKYVVNIQGDEPFIEPQQLKELIGCFDNQQVEVATLIKKITALDELLSPSIVKVIKGVDGEALYFSRAAIPFQRDVEVEEWLNHHTYYKHIGLYGFKRGALVEIMEMEETPLESCEMLEQLRWLERGLKIGVKESFYPSYPIDRPEDIDNLKAKGII